MEARGPFAPLDRKLSEMTRSLRIALCSQQDLRAHPVPAYRFWAEYFRQGLAEAGHVVLESSECDWAKGLLPLNRAERLEWLGETWSRHLDWLKKEHARRCIDLSLSYLFPNQIEPSALAEIRRLGIPTVNFFCDNVREFRHVPSTFRGFDLHWVPEHKAVPQYKAAALPFIHAPMPCWVPPNARQPVAHETLPVTFVGTRDEQRSALFARAIRSGLEVDLRGTGWRSSPAPASVITPRPSVVELLRRQWAFARQHGTMALYRKHRPPPTLKFDFSSQAKSPPEGDEYWSALRESVVCLGVNRYPSYRFPFDAPDTYSRLRDIEAPMVGACYLTEWTAGLDELYDLGSEIETYRSVEELVEKTHRLSSDATQRKRLRIAGQRRALHDHSIPHTLERITHLLGVPRSN